MTAFLANLDIIATKVLAGKIQLHNLFFAMLGITVLDTLSKQLDSEITRIFGNRSHVQQGRTTMLQAPNRTQSVKHVLKDIIAMRVLQIFQPRYVL